jgi:hypothetical protein
MKKLVLAVAIAVVIATGVVNVVQGAPLEIKMKELVNTTVDTVDITNNGNAVMNYKTNVTGLVSIKNRAQENLCNIWVALNLKNISSVNIYSKPSYASVTIYNSISDVPQNVRISMPNSSNANYFVYITLLKPNDKVIVFYNVDDSGMGIENGAPFNVNESYNVTKIPVDAVNTWQTVMNVSVNKTWFAKTALNFDQASINVTKYLSNNDSLYGNSHWQVLYLLNVNAKDEKGAILNPVTFNSNHDTVDTGNPDAFYVTDAFNTNNMWMNISFNLTGKITNITELYRLTKYGFATLKFDLIGSNNNNTISGSHVLDVFAISDLNLSVTKAGPYQNSTGQVALWIGNATVVNPTADIIYNVTAYTLWATPNNISSLNTILIDENTSQKVIKTEYPSIILNPGENYTTDNLKFNYSNVPVIWANVTFTTTHNSTGGWWSWENTTQNNHSVVIEKIYVIRGYLIKVTKHLVWNDTAKAWDVYIVVENIGGMKSPRVWIYDLIPNNYTINWSDANWTTLGDNEWVNKTSMFVGNVSYGDMKTENSVMSGYWYALAWCLNPLEPGANGNGSYSDWTEISNNQSVVIHYQIAGHGKFIPINTFVIGVDPLYSTNSQTTNKITIVSGAKSTNFEPLMALVTGIVGLLAMVVVRK